MLERKSELSDYELLLEVFKDNNVEYTTITPENKFEIIDYFEIINADGSKSRLFGNPNELLLSSDGFFCPKYECVATLKSKTEDIKNEFNTYKLDELSVKNSQPNHLNYKCSKDVDYSPAA